MLDIMRLIVAQDRYPSRKEVEGKMRLGTLLGLALQAAKVEGAHDALLRVSMGGPHEAECKKSLEEATRNKAEKVRDLAKALADLGYRPGDEV